MAQEQIKDNKEELNKMKQKPPIDTLFACDLYRTAIDDFSKEHPEISAAYLFGSTAIGRSRPGSDVDIAFITKKPIDQMKIIEWETSLSNFIGKDVDLVIFNQASPLLKHQILKHGLLIKETHPKDRIKYETIARYEYLDTQQLFKELGVAHG